MKISVVLLNWKGAADTIECATSLGAQVGVDTFDVVVVDNDSDDDVLDRLEQLGPAIGLAPIRLRFETGSGQLEWSGHRASNAPRRLLLVQADSNIGFCRGNNVGAHLATDEGAEAVIILNNDTTVAADFLHQMSIAHRSAGPLTLLSPQILYADEPTTIWWAGGTFGRTLIPRYRNQGGPVIEGENGMLPTEWVSGCATLISGQLIDKIGLYDERFFIWCEEWDLSLRAKESGLTMAVVPQARVWHKVGRSLGIVSPLTFFYSMRNMRLLRRRHLPRPIRTVYGVLVVPRKALQAMQFALRLRDPRYLHGFVDALADNSGGIWRRQEA